VEDPRDKAVEKSIQAFWLAWPAFREWWVKVTPPVMPGAEWQTLPPEPFACAARAFLEAIKPED
jgi:hypothetical protein